MVDLFGDVYFLDDDLDSRWTQILLDGGATRLRRPTEAPKSAKIYFITNDWNSPKCIEAQNAPTASRTLFCTQEWVRVSSMRSRIQDPQRYSPDPRQFFTGVCVTCTELPEGDKEAIYGGVLALGGTYSDDLIKGTTHVVALNMKSEKVIAALEEKRNVEVVLPHWFDDCLQLRRRLPTDSYRFPEPKLLKANTVHSPPLPLSQDASFSYISEAGLNLNALPVETFDDIFTKRKVFLGDDLLLSARVLTSMARVIGSCNGQIAKTLASADIYIGKHRDGPQYLQAERSRIVVGNWLWLFYCISRGKYTSPREHLLHYPVPREGLPEFRRFKITVSNYTGEARTYLERLILALGAEFTRNMRPENTHLITALEHGEKFNTAKEWGIQCTNHLWLEESYAAWQAKPVTNSHYTTFPREVNLTDVIAQTPILQEGVDIFFQEEEEEEVHTPEQLDHSNAQDIEADLSQTEQQAQDESQDIELPLINDVRQFSSSSIPSAIAGNEKSSSPHESLTIAPVPHRDLTLDSTPIQQPTPRTVQKQDLHPITPSRLNESTPGSRGSTTRKAGLVATSKLKDNMEDANLHGQQMRRKNKHKLPPLPNEVDLPIAKRLKTHDADSINLGAKIVLTGCPELTEALHDQCTRVGIDIIEDARHATHVVTPRISRTKKFVVAIPHNPHFVNYTWLLESAKAKKLMPEVDFPPDAAVSAAWSKDLDFDRIRTKAAKLRKKGGLLQGHKILVSDGVCKVGGLETYKEIVEANGGTCSLALRELGKHNDKHTLLIVDGPKDPVIAKYSRKNRDFEVFDREWLMLSCIRQELVSEYRY